ASREGGGGWTPRGGTRENRKFIQAPSPEIWRKTISGAEGGSGEEVGWPVLGYLLRKNFRRHDRDHLVPLVSCRAEVCYPFGGSTGVTSSEAAWDRLSAAQPPPGRSRRGRSKALHLIRECIFRGQGLRRSAPCCQSLNGSNTSVPAINTANWRRAYSSSTVPV